jgi:hypothetical protein
VASSSQSFLLKTDALCDVLTLSLMEGNSNFSDSGSPQFSPEILDDTSLLRAANCCAVSNHIQQINASVKEEKISREDVLALQEYRIPYI